MLRIYVVNKTKQDQKKHLNDTLEEVNLDPYLSPYTKKLTQN